MVLLSVLSGRPPPTSRLAEAHSSLALSLPPYPPTVMLNRLITRQDVTQREAANPDLDFRQLMLTTSPKLCLKMKQQYEEEMRSRLLLEGGARGDRHAAG